MIKNVIIVNDYDYVQGGASLVAIETANLLNNAGYNVIFFCGVSNKEKSLLNKNIQTINVDKYDCLSNPSKIKGMLQGINNKKAYKKMTELLERFDPKETVVSIHGYTKSLSTSFIRACHEKKVKTILTAHDYFSICPNGGLFNYKKNHICNKQGTFGCKLCNCDSRNYIYKLYRNFRFSKQNKKFKFRERIDYLVTISETNENLLRKYFKKSNIIRIYNPTSIDKKEERVKCEEFDTYIYVGRVDKEKGIDLMCDAFLKANAKINILGNGNAYEELKSKYETRNIKFVGWVDHNTVIEYMKTSRALVFPCLLYEGAPLTIFEAQSQGLSCIVSKYSNGKDFINGENGRIYDPYDPLSLVKLLKESKNEEIAAKSFSTFEMFWDKPYDKKLYAKNIMNLLKIIESNEYFSSKI